MQVLGLKKAVIIIDILIIIAQFINYLEKQNKFLFLFFLLKCIKINAIFKSK